MFETIDITFGDEKIVSDSFFLFRSNGLCVHLQELLKNNEVAAVILEPVVGNSGFIPPTKEFLVGLRELTTKYGALLVFDEVMTGFRIAYGGAQEHFGVTPDVTTMGNLGCKGSLAWGLAGWSGSVSANDLWGQSQRGPFWLVDCRLIFLTEPPLPANHVSFRQGHRRRLACGCLRWPQGGAIPSKLPWNQLHLLTNVKGINVTLCWCNSHADSLHFLIKSYDFKAFIYALLAL